MAKAKVITRRFDETNVARLGLISIQERLPDEITSWEEEFEISGKRMRLACYAVAEYGGVPHGLDNDLSLALIALYIDAGSPEDGTFTCNVHQVLKLMGLATTGYYYQALHESLMRLAGTTYVLSEAWRNGDRWENATFRYIDKLHFTSPQNNKRLDASSAIRVTLAAEIASSIRSRYIKPLDLEFLIALERPITRALYRILDAQRIPFDSEPDAAVNNHVFEANLEDWAKACKINQRRPDKIRRTLEGAHKDLIRKGYLRSVEYLGRGGKQRIRYVFGKEIGQPLDPAVVEALTQEGVSPLTAQALARKFTRERVLNRIELFRAILANGYNPRNRVGFLVDVIRDEDGKYAEPEGGARKTTQPVRRDKKSTNQPNQRNEEEADEWANLSHEEQVAKTVRILQMIAGKRLRLARVEEIATDLRDGRLNPREFCTDLLKAQVGGRLSSWLEQWSA
jgi:plasmid replication initiation protein